VLARVPVIVITARQIVTPEPVGVSDVLLKPFDLEALQAAIARVVDHT